MDASGDITDFGARVFDANFPMFLSRDPKESGYSGLSPYQFSNSNPISYIEINGEHFGYYIDNTEGNKSIILTYTINEATESEAKKAALLWNESKFNVDGYKVIFKINVILPDDIVKSDDPRILKGDVESRYFRNDPIGNIYVGTYSSLKEYISPVSDNSETYVGGETLNGEFIFMNVHYSHGNMGKDEKKVGHEFGHLFGLDDDKVGNNTYFPGDNSIMKYRQYFLPPTIEDVKMILKYIEDFNSGKTTEDDKVKVKELEDKPK